MIQLLKTELCIHILVKNSLFFSPVGNTASRNAVDNNNKASKKWQNAAQYFFHNKNSVVSEAVTSQIKVKQN